MAIDLSDKIKQVWVIKRTGIFSHGIYHNGCNYPIFESFSKTKVENLLHYLTISCFEGAQLAYQDINSEIVNVK